MKHHSTGRIFGRVRKQRTALLRHLARSLILHEKINTTEAKAKELRPFVEKLVTHGKKDSIAARRTVSTRLGNAPTETKKLFDTVVPRYKDRAGGYIRITKLSPRRGDASPMAQIEFV
jgi:large subunit ribosomal protein L17|tara:strand:+ start:56551 stop:56904 length:354 start_codon:yes stop_codon:yes gene_type:complete